jgi:hypothetical protein
MTMLASQMITRTGWFQRRIHFVKKNGAFFTSTKSSGV